MTLKLDLPFALGVASALACCTGRTGFQRIDGLDPFGGDGGPGAVLIVGKAYPSLGNWNDYVRKTNALLDDESQPEIACDGTEFGPRDACIHAGEKLAVTVRDATSCAGLSLADDLDAFVWECREDDPVRYQANHEPLELLARLDHGVDRHRTRAAIFIIQHHSSPVCVGHRWPRHSNLRQIERHHGGAKHPQRHRFAPRSQLTGAASPAVAARRKTASWIS